MSIVKCSYTDETLKNTDVSFALFFQESVQQQELIESLQRVLLKFPIYNGDYIYIEGKLCIQFNPSKTPDIRIAKLNKTLIEELNVIDNNEKIHLVEPVRSCSSLKGKTPNFTVKLTYFSCGGMCIGVSFNHAIGDMNSFVNLMQAWANEFNGKDYVSPCLIKDREEFILAKTNTDKIIKTGLRYLNSLDFLKLIYFMLVKARDRQTLRFYFSPAELVRLKKDFNAQCDRKVTTGDALSGHLFALISRLDPSVCSRYLSVAVNARSMLGISKQVMGNIINSINILSAQPCNSYEIASQIRAAVENYRLDHLDFHSNHQFINAKGGRRNIGRFIPRALDPEKGNLLITNWSNMGLFDVNFNHAKLFYFAPVGRVPVPWVSAIAEGFNGKGLIYTVTVPAKMATALKTAGQLKEIHKYREPEPAGRAITDGFSWLY